MVLKGRGFSGALSKQWDSLPEQVFQQPMKPVPFNVHLLWTCPQKVTLKLTLALPPAAGNGSPMPCCALLLTSSGADPELLTASIS